MISGGKAFITADDMAASMMGQRDPAAKEKFQAYLQSQGITNGQLTKDQFSGYLAQMRANRQGGGGGGPGGGRNRDPQADDQRAAEFFKQLDKNNDGVLTSDEIPEESPLKAEFAKWDVNHNGQIELDEFKAYFKARMENLRGDQPQGSGTDWMQALPGQADPQEEDKRPTVYHVGNLPLRELPPWWTQVDRDNDGQICVFEWKEAGRSMEEFRAMDLNGDGFITVEEALRYLKANNSNSQSGPRMMLAGGPPGGGWPGMGGPGFGNGPGAPMAFGAPNAPGAGWQGMNAGNGANNWQGRGPGGPGMGGQGRQRGQGGQGGQQQDQGGGRGNRGNRGNQNNGGPNNRIMGQ
jgi:Ca2+-binding EF-hand superfamily protein